MLDFEKNVLNCCAAEVQYKIFKEMFDREPNEFELEEILKTKAEIFYDSRNQVKNA